MGDDNNGFSEYKKLFLSEFADIKKDIGELQKGQIRMIIAVEQLKIKASLWGAAAGGLPVLMVYLFKELSK